MWCPTHVQVTVQRAKGLLTKGKNQTNDCFVTIALGKEKYQTSVKEKAPESVEWHEECELQIPTQGNKAEVILTALHRNFLGVDEFLGMVTIPLSSFDVYERPRNRWYNLDPKPGKEKTKERGALEVKIGFTVKAGSLTDLTRKEKHKSSLGQLSTAAQSIGGSLLSIGSLEKRKGLKKLAKSIGNRVKGKSKNKLNKDDFDEIDELRPSRQEPGEADPGVISEDEDEFAFDQLSHKSSASSLNAPVSTPSNNTTQNSLSRITNESSTPTTPPAPPATIAPNKPPRFTSSNSSPKIDERDEWGRKLYGLQPNSALKRWDKSNPKIVIEEPKDISPAASPVPRRLQSTPEPPSPAPREIILPKRSKDDNKLKDSKHSKEHFVRDKSPIPKDDKPLKSPKEDNKLFKRDKKKDKDNNKGKDIIDDNHRLSSERIIIGEDAVKQNMSGKSRLPHEVLQQFEGKTREDLIELTLQLQSEVIDKRKRLADLEDYIDALLLRVIECSPRLLQNPYQSNRRLSSPGKQ